MISRLGRRRARRRRAPLLLCLRGLDDCERRRVVEERGPDASAVRLGVFPPSDVAVER